jgi:hypothetical protein
MKNKGTPKKKKTVIKKLPFECYLFVITFIKKTNTRTIMRLILILLIFKRKKKGFYFVFIDKNTIKLSVTIINGGHKDKINLVAEKVVALLWLFFKIFLI